MVTQTPDAESLAGMMSVCNVSLPPSGLLVYIALETTQTRHRSTLTIPHFTAAKSLLTSPTMSYNKDLDPYTAKAENNNLTPQEKIDGLHAIVKSVKTGMLTTRAANGELHSRAMAPAGRMSRIHNTHGYVLLIALTDGSRVPHPSDTSLHRKPGLTQV